RSPHETAIDHVANAPRPCSPHCESGKGHWASIFSPYGATTTRLAFRASCPAEVRAAWTRPVSFGLSRSALSRPIAVVNGREKIVQPLNVRQPRLVHPGGSKLLVECDEP